MTSGRRVNREGPSAIVLRRLALGALVAILGVSAGVPSAAVAGGTEVVSVPVGFPVENLNRSGVACDSDGKPYTLHAELVGPRDLLSGRRPLTATLYLHEYGFDDFWHFTAVPAVDYATEMAKAGHVSIALDRLGYDDSPRPDGNAMCLGSQADMAHQMVEQLRRGSYTSPDLTARRFQHVVLAGHSAGAAIAEIEAYSFGNVEALMLFGQTDGGYSSDTTRVGLAQGLSCGQGGDGDLHNYAFFGSAEDSRRLAYADADPAVVDAQAAARHPDPCGDVNSLIPAVTINKKRIGEIKVPVLLLYGKKDATMTSDAPRQQAGAYTASKEVTTAFFDKAGHAFAIERAAPLVRSTVSLYLNKHGFGPPTARPTPAPAAPLLHVRGLRHRRCVRHRLTLRIRVDQPDSLLRLRVLLDGRRIKRTRRAKLTVRVSAKRLRPGKHRVAVIARGTAGTESRSHGSFTRCGSARL
jgi:pimeloyl-ACP methyl ester carboxylesterase